MTTGGTRMTTGGELPRKPEPNCPRCGNNRQVWANQITGIKTCHRAWCHTEIAEREHELD